MDYLQVTHTNNNISKQKGLRLTSLLSLNPTQGSDPRQPMQQRSQNLTSHYVSGSLTRRGPLLAVASSGTQRHLRFNSKIKYTKSYMLSGHARYDEFIYSLWRGRMVRLESDELHHSRGGDHRSRGRAMNEIDIRYSLISHRSILTVATVKGNMAVLLLEDILKFKNSHFISLMLMYISLLVYRVMASQLRINISELSSLRGRPEKLERYRED
ncbi:hypothetical protein MTR_6g033830 [Medicago truncatula]|uniref:Uncharacterized protein n=1 Tax=Medicago truncatula TaxID=3880 RepID=A0A072U7Q2_MEDTR|nr:hypothetical protein MTR_6g033830 [Medicago truncatula]